MAKVFNKNNYLTYPDGAYKAAAQETLDLESEIRVQSKTLTKRLLYDLCTNELENKLLYLRARLEYVDRNY